VGAIRAILQHVAKAKAEAVYKGRPASIDADRVRQMKAEGIGATEIARALGGIADQPRTLRFRRF